MKIRAIILSLCLSATVGTMFAQSKKSGFTPSENRHELRFSYSDGSPLIMSGSLAGGLSDAILGSKRSDEQVWGVFGLGYRYSISRFKIGADLGFSSTTSKLALSGEKTPSIKEKELHFMILPTGEISYFRRGIVELYGSLSAGVDLRRHSESALRNDAKNKLSKSSLSTDFAYQVNPIALRVGNDRIGGFVEGGFGTKGFVTAGISVGF